MSHFTLDPNTQFPQIDVTLTSGGSVTLSAQDGKAKLVVVYRGHFCPFCLSTLQHVQSKHAELRSNQIDVVAVSADSVDVARNFAETSGLTFPIAAGLAEVQMRTLGLYISDPKGYQPQAHVFAEPAYFLLDADNSIRYLSYGSHPMGGRVNVDSLLAGINWVKDEGERNAAFKDYKWGTK
jgi:peroxiredoxin